MIGKKQRAIDRLHKAKQECIRRGYTRDQIIKSVEWQTAKYVAYQQNWESLNGISEVLQKRFK